MVNTGTTQHNTPHTHTKLIGKARASQEKKATKNEIISKKKFKKVNFSSLVNEGEKKKKEENDWSFVNIVHFFIQFPLSLSPQSFILHYFAFPFTLRAIVRSICAWNKHSTTIFLSFCFWNWRKFRKDMLVEEIVSLVKVYFFFCQSPSINNVLLLVFLLLKIW